MSCRLSRNQTLAIATLSLLLVCSATPFLMGPAPGEPVKQEISEGVAPSGGPVTDVPVTQTLALSDRKAVDEDDQPEIIDRSVVYPQGKNPTDDPLAVFNTPIQ
jgi:hypothetical protein